MSLTNIKEQVNQLWLEFHQGGVTNPLTVIEQISYLIFCRILDMNESRDERVEKRTGKSFQRRFSEEDQDIRWSNLLHETDPEKLLEKFRDRVFPHFKEVGGKDSTFSKYMADAVLMIQRPKLMATAMDMVQKLPLGDDDTKGNLYEYMLSKLTTAGISGQFRTPRHIIEMMVELVDPKIGEKIVDPSCGTAGFLVGGMKHLLRANTSEKGIFEEDDGSKIYTADLLSEEERNVLKEGMLFGFDFDSTMLRVGSMNLFLHGVENPNVFYQDTMGQAFEDRYPELSNSEFDVVLANPPFKGSLDYDSVAPDLLSKVKTKKTELLFLVLMLRMMKTGGRCAVIVPQGVLFGSSKAHKGLRQILVEQNQLDAVINMPSGVFKPYAGVATAILIFTKGGETKDVWFYDMENDGLSLDDNRTAIDKNDIPEILERWKNRETEEEVNRKRTEKSFYVPKSELVENEFDLSVNRYKEIEYEAPNYDPPQEIIDELIQLEGEIQKGLVELKGMLG